MRISVRKTNLIPCEFEEVNLGDVFFLFDKSDKTDKTDREYFLAVEGVNGEDMMAISLKNFIPYLFCKDSLVCLVKAELFIDETKSS